jgi:hypothetical protein
MVSTLLIDFHFDLIYEFCIVHNAVSLPIRSSIVSVSPASFFLKSATTVLIDSIEIMIPITPIKTET